MHKKLERLNGFAKTHGYEVRGIKSLFIWSRKVEVWGLYNPEGNLTASTPSLWKMEMCLKKQIND